MIELITQQQFEALLEKSQSQPVFIFKHSDTCPTSASAFNRVAQVIQSQNGAMPEVHLIEVKAARPVSNEIASRLGVRHQSPQMILVKAGEAVWNASHHDIGPRQIAEAIEKNT